MFKSHLNVELYLSRVGGTKYLFKYNCKLHNRSTIQTVCGQETSDEIGQFQDARYGSASEAL